MSVDTDGVIVCRQAYALGCEGITSKRLGSPYRGRRTDVWLKIKNPLAPAVRHEAEEEEWRQRRDASQPSSPSCRSC
jgi:ATP-dependent DNA ligase